MRVPLSASTTPYGSRCAKTPVSRQHPALQSWTRAVGQDNAKRGRNGYDAGKKVKGRKRHIAAEATFGGRVDTLGLLLAVVVHSAGIQDRDGARLVCLRLRGKFTRLRLIWADGGYSGQFIGWVAAFAGWTLQIVKRCDKAKGFVVLPRRWVVERTFAWLMKFRRLSRDYEETTTSSEAWIQIAMIHIMVRRLA